MSEQASSKWISLGLLMVSVLALLIGVVAVVGNVQPGDSKVATEKKDQAKMLSVIGNIAKGDQLMLINLSGPIMMQAENSGPFGAEESNAVKVRQALEEALDEPRIKGVLLAINSPGGTVGMSQELNAAVTRLEKEKPVVAYLGDVAASGGYYTACAATKIVSNPGTLTGSIGVIISTLNFKDLMVDKLGIQAYTIKSGRFKDLLSPYRQPSSAELQLVQDMIDTSYQQFISAVISGRTRYITDKNRKKELTASIKSVADGRIVIGEQAKTVGLVDEIGDIQDAYDLLDRMAKERAGIKGDKQLPLVEYSDGGSLLEFLGFGVSASSPSVESMLPMSLRYANQPLWIME